MVSFRFVLFGLNDGDAETVLLARCPQEIRCSGPGLAEVKVIAGHRVADPQPVDQDVADEVRRLDPGKLPVERQYQDAVQAAGAQDIRLLVARRQTEDGLVRIENRARVRLEGHRKDGNAIQASFRQGRFQNGPVSRGEPRRNCRWQPTPPFRCSGKASRLDITENSAGLESGIQGTFVAGRNRPRPVTLVIGYTSQRATPSCPARVGAMRAGNCRLRRERSSAPVVVAVAADAVWKNGNQRLWNGGWQADEDVSF